MRIIVPYGRDGASDRVARIVGHALARSLAGSADASKNSTLEIINRPGGGTVPGTFDAARAVPDGTTLLLATVTNWSIAPLLDPQLPYDPARDFRLLGVIGVAPNILCVPPGSPWHSVGDLLAAARTRPGQLAYASAGTGQTIHLCGAAFARLAGVEMRHAPYDAGSAAAYDDLRAGRIDMMADSIIGAWPDLHDGRLRALAVVAPERLALLPHVPTLAEAGMPSMLAPIWFGLATQAAVRDVRQDELRAHVVEVMADRVVVAALAQLGLDARPSAPDLLQTSRAAWRANIISAGMQPVR